MKIQVISYLSLCLHFNGHFPGEPGIAGVYWSKGWRWWWQLNYRSYKSCKASVKSSSPPTNQHSVFLQAGCPVAQPTVSKHWRVKNITFHGLIYPKLTWGVFQLRLWPLIAPGYLGGGLPCLSSARWCQYPVPHKSYINIIKSYQVDIWHLFSGDQQFCLPRRSTLCLLIHTFMCINFTRI